jgi:hypothetical protein
MAQRERLLRRKLRLPQGLIERAGAPNSAVLKGHGFSRAAKAAQKIAALAAEGILVVKKDSPQGLKLKSSANPQSARLKSSPFKTSDNGERGKLKPRPFEASKAKRS